MLFCNGWENVIDVSARVPFFINVRAKPGAKKSWTCFFCSRKNCYEDLTKVPMKFCKKLQILDRNFGPMFSFCLVSDWKWIVERFYEIFRDILLEDIEGKKREMFTQVPVLGEKYMMLCVIWYHLHHLKNAENIHEGLLLLLTLTLTLLKVTLHHGCFSRFLNCANGTKSRKASYM